MSTPLPCAGPKTVCVGRRPECESRRDSHVATSLRDAECVLEPARMIDVLSSLTAPRMERPECESLRDSHVAASLRDAEGLLRFAKPQQFRRIRPCDVELAARFTTKRYGTVEMRVSERIAHVARSLRDRGCGLTDSEMGNNRFGWSRKVWNGRNASLGETRPRGPVSPRPGMRFDGLRDGEQPVRLESEGMERPECESLRDSPTWPGLSETGNAV